jgi:hypothetical protein
MKRTARCACGDAFITVEGEPSQFGICHCGNCRRRTGSAFGLSAYFPKAAVIECGGAMNEFAFHHATFNHDQSRHFCARCGTTLTWTISTLPDLIGIAGGCFTDPPLGTPTYSTSHSQCLEWVRVPEGIERGG